MALWTPRHGRCRNCGELTLKGKPRRFGMITVECYPKSTNRRRKLLIAVLVCDVRGTAYFEQNPPGVSSRT